MTVPADAVPGEIIYAEAPDGSGRRFSVVVHETCLPGSSYLMRIPPRRRRWRLKYLKNRPSFSGNSAQGSSGGGGGGGDGGNPGGLPILSSASSFIIEEANYGQGYACKNTVGKFSTIVTMLQNNCPIIEIHLRNYYVGDDGAADIAGALRTNTKLQTLLMRNCGLGDASAVSFASALRENSTLKSLNIQRNNINQEGTTAIAETLQCYNHTLSCVHFDQTGLDKLHKLIQTYLKINAKYGPLEAQARKTGRFPRTHLAAISDASSALLPLVVERAVRTEYLDVVFDFVREKSIEVSAGMMTKRLKDDRKTKKSSHSIELFKMTPRRGRSWLRKKDLICTRN